MNVLFIEQHPRFIGGSERISLSICTFLRQRGHSTRLLYETTGNMVGAYAAVTAGIHQAAVRPLAMRRPLDAARSLFRLRRLLREHRIDVMFTSQLGYISLLAVAHRLCRVPAVVHLGLSLRFDSSLFRWSMPRIAAAVAPSEHTRQAWLAAGWPAGRVEVIPNGVDLGRFRPAENPRALRESVGLPGDGLIVAYVGRMVREKGVFTLLQAAALLRARGLAFHLAMVGSSPDGQAEALMAAAAGLGLGPGLVSIRPATDTPELFYAAADAVAVPSEWDEPFGLAAIEAMACGTVPIVSDAGILPDIVGPELARCVYPRGDPSKLADRLQFILADASERRAIAGAGLARVRACYDLARCGEAYERELERCARAR